MLNPTLIVFVALAITLLNTTVYAETKTVTYKISLTIPTSIVQNNTAETAKQTPNQMIQTTPATRANQQVLIRSIVAQ